MINRRILNTLACSSALLIGLASCGSGADSTAGVGTKTTASADTRQAGTTSTTPDLLESTVPEATVPEATVPEATVPETTAPETTAPETTAPETTEPAATVGPPLVEGLAALALTEPAADAQSSTPRFGWQPVAGAATYRLVVVGPAGPIWAWEGGATTVRLGGLAGERPAGFGGPVIVGGSSWSVVALDGAGQLVAVSELRSIGADEQG